MKKSFQLLVLAVLMLGATACTLFEKDIQIVQEFEFDINEPAGSALAFSKTKTVNTQNEDISSNQDQIEKFELDRITVQVASYSGTTTRHIAGLELYYAPLGSSDYKKLGTIRDLDLQALANSKQEVPVVLAGTTAKDDPIRADLINMMKAGNTVVFKLNGTTSENPIVTKLKFNVYANMTVAIKTN